jgi:hypothetical protein
MSVTLVVNKTPFEYPEQGDQAPWGEAATAWAKEVTKVLESNVIGLYDIPETTVPVLNNANNVFIPTFSFDTANVRAFQATGTIVRTAIDLGGNATELAETFIINGLNLGSSWVITQEGIGNSGVTLRIQSSTGIMFYNSTELFGQNTGTLKFKATSVTKV